MKYLFKAAALAALFSLTSYGQAFTVQSTAYSPTVGQTDSTPHITATGSRVRTGIVALSRDLLKKIPYGSIVQLTNVRGSGCGGYTTGPLRVEDTMAARKVN